VSELRLRPGVRALIVDDDERILLCRWDFPDAVVWGTPGGGIEPGESRLDALRRELVEEVGLILDTDPPHVWNQVVVAADRIPGFDGLENDFYLLRTPAFTPDGSLSAEELAAENLCELRWWTQAELAAHAGPALFAPRDLGERLAALLHDDLPTEPLPVGL
jgi:8-oxo-dGTP pyrophosphatase MutT (NUDIX family)